MHFIALGAASLIGAAAFGCRRIYDRQQYERYLQSMEGTRVGKYDLRAGLRYAWAQYDRLVPYDLHCFATTVAEFHCRPQLPEVWLRPHEVRQLLEVAEVCAATARVLWLRAEAELCFGRALWVSGQRDEAIARLRHTFHALRQARPTLTHYTLYSDSSGQSVRLVPYNTSLMCRILSELKEMHGVAGRPAHQALAARRALWIELAAFAPRTVECRVLAELTWLYQVLLDFRQAVDTEWHLSSLYRIEGDPTTWFDSHRDLLGGFEFTLEHLDTSALTTSRKQRLLAMARRHLDRLSHLAEESPEFFAQQEIVDLVTRAQRVIGPGS